MVFSIVYPWKNILAFFCVSKLKLSAWPCTVIIHEPEMLFIIIKKKGELKAVYGFVSKVILSVWQDEVTRAG